jgi:hypothetical protein
VLYKLEVHVCLVARPEAVGRHVHDGGRLTDGAAVDHGLGMRRRVLTDCYFYKCNVSNELSRD